MKKWTIAFVNYKTSVYLNWQIKGLYEFNDPESFDLIIVDNSRPHEKEALEQLTKNYNEQYNNIKIIYYTPQEQSASGQHGEGMSVALKEANSEYFFAQDPDFFFVKQQYLNFMEEHLKKGAVAIGAPYPRGVGGGHPYFPCAYGCAHPMHLIKDLDFTALVCEEKREESLRLYPDLDYSYDVGWKIRLALSTEKDSRNFVVFDQEDFYNLADSIGCHTYELISKKYSLNGEDIAFHLFRGSFTDAVDGFNDKNKDLSSRLLKIRNKMGRYFYDYISTEKKPYIRPSYRMLKRKIKTLKQKIKAIRHKLFKKKKH